MKLKILLDMTNIGLKQLNKNFSSSNLIKNRRKTNE